MDDKWTFSESFAWTGQCLAPNQSPININTDPDVIQICKSLCDFKLYYKPSKCFVNYKNNLVRLKYSSGSYLEFNNILYELTEITIHVPTLHNIDNSKYDLEICMIHKLSNDNKTTTTSETPNGIILCRLFEAGPHHGNPEQFINQFINEIPNETIDFNKEISVSKDWGVNMLIPENKSYYIYDGSLPFPPCDTNYKVIVYEDIGSIGETNLEIFKLNIGENIRITQDIGDRVVMYKPYYKKNTESKIGISDNKYLKCAKNPLSELLVKPIGTEPVTETISDEGVSTTTKHYMKQIILLIIIILLFINAWIFVKYLFGNFKLHTLLILLVGRDYIEASLPSWASCNRDFKDTDN
jgi:carbonic anhydrase